MENITKKSILDLKYNKLRKVIHGVEIYNPDAELSMEIENEMIKRMVENLTDKGEEVSLQADIGQLEIIARYLPMLTNIETTDDALVLMEVIKNPSPELEDIIEEIEEMLTRLTTRAFKKLNKSAAMISEVMESSNMDEDDKIKFLESLSAEVGE